MDKDNMDDILGEVVDKKASAADARVGATRGDVPVGPSDNTPLTEALETINRMESLLAKSAKRLAELEGEIGVYQQSHATLIKQPVVRREDVLKEKDSFIAASHVEQEGRYIYKITPVFDAGDGPQRTTVHFNVHSDLPPEAPAGEPQPFGFRQMLMAEVGVRNKVQYSPETHEAILVPQGQRSEALN